MSCPQSSRGNFCLHLAQHSRLDKGNEGLRGTARSIIRCVYFLLRASLLVPSVSTVVAVVRSRVLMEEPVGKTVKRMVNGSSVIVLQDLLASCAEIVVCNKYI